MPIIHCSAIDLSLLSPMIKFHYRFGGNVSFFQQLEDLKYKKPIKNIPLLVNTWTPIVKYLEKLWIQFRIRSEIEKVKTESEKIKQDWQEFEHKILYAEIVKKASEIQKENPNANVSVIDINKNEKYVPDNLVILIEHPPDGSKAQAVLGGTLEIRSPWIGEIDNRPAQ
jgi:hypothetical protein